MRNCPKWLISSLLASSLLLWQAIARAADAALPTPVASPSAAPAGDGSGAEHVNVDSIKEKYWARGDESELGVVQNRLYSKKNRFELGLFMGSIQTDPFLSVRSLGGSIGYHFSEYFALHAIYWKDIVNPSAALLTFQQNEGATTNTNPPIDYYGLEAEGSFLYGKLSLVGKSIIYYDMHILGGIGATNTDSGVYFTPDVGIGEQIYLNRSFSISIDYRLDYYDETIVEKVITPKLGQPVGTRSNWTNSVTLGVNFLFGPGAKVQEPAQ